MADPTALSQLRHLYQNMVNGAVRDTASAKRIAEGLLAPAIEALERATPPAVAGEPVAWLSTDCIGERYLCFTKPKDSDHVRPLVFGDVQAGAVPPEAEPIVRNCEAPGDLKPGDYVFASRWSDCDPGDPWEVGFVSEVGFYPESMTKAGYVVLQGGSRRWGRAMRITPEQGRRICEQFPSMERLPQDYGAIARVFGIKGGQHGADN